MRGFIQLTGSEFGANIFIRHEDISSVRDVGATKEQNLRDTNTILGMCSGSALFVTESTKTVMQLIEKDSEGPSIPAVALRRA